MFKKILYTIVVFSIIGVGLYVASACMSAHRYTAIHIFTCASGPSAVVRVVSAGNHIAWQMFTDSRELLIKSGHLVVVGNRHLDYHIKLKKLFGGAKVLASDKKFVILGTAKR